MAGAQQRLFKTTTIPERIRTSDDQPVSYKGFSTINENSDGYKLYDFELIKQDIINNFNIRRGEKLSDPEFGTIIWDVLFEPFNDDIKDAVIQDVTSIVNYDPRVSVVEIIVDEFEHGLALSCTLEFIPYNISEQLFFTFDQRAIQPSSS
jgi:phage baseplate assembly protein W